MAGLFLILSTFLASLVEMVEALTIVLATGVTRGWRSALLGAGAALLALAALVVIFGPVVATLIPIEALRLVIGLLLLIFGLQWLRKAILRAAGLKALHDVVTFGSSAGDIPLAAAGALLALALVGVVGAVAHRPLSRVPENAIAAALGGSLAWQARRSRG
jgi:Ca2+/H+ antiporter, TMEM165/GDT1 family